MSALCIALCCFCAALLAGLAWQWRRGVASKRALLAAMAARQDAVRLLRLTAGELRAPALTLKGHAERGLAPPGAGLLAVAQRLLDVAQGLLDQTEQPDAARTLADETFQLGPVLDFVIAQVTTQLGPGSRAWHIAADLHHVALLADRRAVHQVLLRVVTAAALATRDSDWIDIKGAAGSDGWALVVEDEGSGLPVETMAERGPESRGIGVGLALARSLMQAHGGSLTIESAAQVGTRAVIRFPRERLLAAL